MIWPVNLWPLGYLLDPNGEKCVTSPRQVSALHYKDVSIAMVAASNGATVCVTVKGDVYLLAEYQCKKLASKWVIQSHIIKKYSRLALLSAIWAQTYSLLDYVGMHAFPLFWSV